jgi:hypothetical protein
MGNDLAGSLSRVHRQPPRADEREVDSAAILMMRSRLPALQADGGAKKATDQTDLTDRH